MIRDNLSLLIRTFAYVQTTNIKSDKAYFIKKIKTYI